MKVFGVTHHEFDFDGGSCLKLLAKHGDINESLFGEEELKAAMIAGGVDKLIFVDSSPEVPLSGLEVVVYDHHQRKDDNNQERIQVNETALDILLNAIGICGFNQDKIQVWCKIVRLGDQKAQNDNMDIMRCLKRVHLLLEDDRKVFDQWFSPLFESFFNNQYDLDNGIRLLSTSIDRFLSNMPESAAKMHLERWSERLKDKRKIETTTIRNLVHFVAYMKDSIANDWLDLTLESYDKEQTLFQEAKRDFSRANFDFYGDTLIISAISKNSMLVHAATNAIYSEDQDKISLIREKITNRNDPWLLMMVNPENKNFQIFVKGNKKLSHMIIAELVKAIRAEILLKREKKVFDADTLSSQGGILEGTEPMYYHKLETGYSCILWGGLKYPAEAATVFGNTSVRIRTSLIEIIKLALDDDEYPEGCNPLDCEDCSIFQWQLNKCSEKRKSIIGNN